MVLRELREDDRRAVLATMSDPLVVRWLNMPARPSERDFDSLLRQVADGWASGDRIDYAVTTVDDDAPVGAVIASRRHRDNYELAYLAGAAGRGRGLMTRAVRILCDWLFGEGVGRIELRTHPDNLASRGLAERCGFRQEGRERKSIWLHGRREDALLFALLPSDPR